MYIFFVYNFRESSFAATLGHKESLQELTLNLVSLTFLCDQCFIWAGKNSGHHSVLNSDIIHILLMCMISYTYKNVNLKRHWQQNLFRSHFNILL